MKNIIIATMLILILGNCEKEREVSVKCVVDQMKYYNNENLLEVDFQYNEKDQLTAIVNKGVESYYAEYKNGKLFKVLHNYSDTTEYAYEYSKSRIKVTQIDVSSADMIKDVIIFKLNSSGRIVEKYSQVFGSKVTYTWSEGNLVKAISGTVEYTYGYDTNINPFANAVLLKLNPILGSKNNPIYFANTVYGEPYDLELTYDKKYPINYPVSSFFPIFSGDLCEIIYSNCGQ